MIEYFIMRLIIVLLVPQLLLCSSYKHLTLTEQSSEIAIERVICIGRCVCCCR